MQLGKTANASPTNPFPVSHLMAINSRASKNECGERKDKKTIAQRQVSGGEAGGSEVKIN
jgi:hypothetical protein